MTWQITAVIALVSALAGAGVTHRYHVGENAIRENARNEAIRLRERANRAAEQQGTKQVIGAINAATKREQDARAAAAGARSELDRLRDDLSTSRGGLPSLAPDACRQRVTALETVFEQCAGRLEELAGKADRHANDTVKLEQSWPKNLPSSSPSP